MSRSDSAGQAITRTELYDSEYNYLIHHNLILQYVSASQKFSLDENGLCIIPVIIGSQQNPMNNLSSPSGVTWILVFDNQTKVATFTGADSSGNTQYWNLTAIKRSTGKEDETICSNSATASSTTLTCNLSGYDGTFWIQAWHRRNPTVLLEQIITFIRDAAQILATHKDALLLGIMLILTFGLTGIWHPVVGVIMTITAAILANMLGVTALQASMISIIIIGGIIIYHMKQY